METVRWSPLLMLKPVRPWTILMCGQNHHIGRNSLFFLLLAVISAGPQPRAESFLVHLHLETFKWCPLPMLNPVRPLTILNWTCHTPSGKKSLKYSLLMVNATYIYIYTGSWVKLQHFFLVCMKVITQLPSKLVAMVLRMRETQK
jgi:hypothetical protein